MLCKVYTKQSGPQQSQCFKQGFFLSSDRGGQGTQPLRVAAARHQVYFPSQSPTPSGGVIKHVNHAPLRQSPSKGTNTNSSYIPLQHAGRESQKHTCQDSLNLSQFHHSVHIQHSVLHFCSAPRVHSGCHCGSSSPSVRVAKPNTQANIKSSHHYTQPPTNSQQNNQKVVKRLN